MTLKEIEKSGKMAYFSACCCWWTTLPEDLGKTPEKEVTITLKDGTEKTLKFSIPCCPHCASPLLKAPIKYFLTDARNNENCFGKGKLKSLVNAYSRNSSTCYRDWDKYIDNVEEKT